MSLLDVNLRKEYRSPRDDIVNDFYIPLLKEAVLYKRSVGFFSSSSLLEISYGLTRLINNNGKIQLIASPNLSEEDIEAINKGYEIRESVIERALLQYITEPQNYFEEERLNLLATLIAEEKLDIKIAFSLKNDKLGLYHEKLGLIYDNENNTIAFSGSMNETENAFVNNYEIVDVFTSWEDNDRVIIKEKAFDKLWNNEDSSALICEFPKVAKEKLLSYKKENVDWNIDEKEFANKIKESIQSEKIKKLKSVTNSPEIPAGVSLHDYQKNAISNWKNNNYCGIFDMATGTGKTFTGLGAITQLYNDLKGKLAVIIVCPYQHLVDQWVEDILNFNINPIIGHSSSEQRDFKQRFKMAIMDYNLGVRNFFCFVCTNGTFVTDYIQSQINNIRGKVLLVVDEAHNFGATNLKQTLIPKFNYRLALSATLERHGDEEGTQALLDYFGKKCIEFSLDEAIKNKFLTPYEYHPIIVYLNEEELEEYHQLSKEISRCIIKKNGKTKLSERGNIIAQERARLVAGASNKTLALAKAIKPYQKDNHILVYCGATTIDEQDKNGDDMRQIDIITELLGKKMNMNVAQFTSREDSITRDMLKKKFSDGDYLQVLVAIKCLDEGVNIPEIKTAFILASTTNPKEYIQRRGRVLRKYPGKEFAIIYDFITLPRPLEETIHLTYEEIRCEKTMVKNEINRMIEFKRLALNKMESDILIDEITNTYHLNDFDNVEEEELYE
ncbi:MAG: DEAD/DEAH box helicase family protein [Clostridia bacterium]|nr:DEAD/DEAH box helicase family protein [Clostridia bacterium]